MRETTPANYFSKTPKPCQFSGLALICFVTIFYGLFRNFLIVCTWTRKRDVLIAQQKKHKSNKNDDSVM